MKSYRSCSVPDVIAASRNGFAAKEVVIAAAIVLVFTMGMYYLGEQSFARLYHFLSTMVGSPYL